MAPLTGLPDPDTLEVFSYYDPDVDEMIPIVSDDNTHPRKVDDYVIDPSDWKAQNRGGVHYDKGSGSPVGVETVEEILGYNTGNFGCIVCGRKGLACHGHVCIDIAKDYFQYVADLKLQIRKARWGFGVFARERIPKGTGIGEYIGRLLPFDGVSRTDNPYIFTIGGRADCDAERYCNITHFINHHCDCNTDPIKAMYGKRAVVVLKTNRDIAAGEEITIDYGTDYFSRYRPCECDAFDYPHTSETYRRRVWYDRNHDVSLQGFWKCRNMNQPLFPPMRKSVRRGPLSKTKNRKLEELECESEPDSARAEVAAPKAKRRRTEELECESGPDSARADVAASRVKRRRTCMPVAQSRSDKGDEPDRCSLSRHARIGDNTVFSGQSLPATKYYSTKKLVIWGV